MILSLIGGFVAANGMTLFVEGSALAITTYYTAKATKNTTSKRK